MRSIQYLSITLGLNVGTQLGYFYYLPHWFLTLEIKNQDIGLNCVVDLCATEKSPFP